MLGEGKGLADIKEVLNRLLSIAEGEFRLGTVLERRIEALEKREKELLDRIMARSYGEFILGQDVEKEEMVEVVEHSRDMLEENAGETLEIEE